MIAITLVFPPSAPSFVVFATPRVTTRRWRGGRAQDRGERVGGRLPARVVARALPKKRHEGSVQKRGGRHLRGFHARRAPDGVGHRAQTFEPKFNPRRSRDLKSLPAAFQQFKL